MNYFQNVYIFFHSFFEFLTFRTKPKYKSFMADIKESYKNN